MLIGTPGSGQGQGNEEPGEDGNNDSHDQGENHRSVLVLFLEVFILHTSTSELLDLHMLCNEVLFLYTWTSGMSHQNTSMSTCYARRYWLYTHVPMTCSI